MIILGIETSCDETAVSVVRGNGDKVEVISNVVSSQIEIHKKYGGVVPEVAAREHVLNILPVLDKALRMAGVSRLDPPRPSGTPPERGLDCVAVTVGPGLITSLQTGIETAKVLAYAWDLSVVGINHIEGHVYANFIGEGMKIDFPALILTVSGGHTMLVLMNGHGKYKIIGETRDDAAGEAFDKAAKMMDLGYPGGSAVAAKAAKFGIRNLESGIKLPRPMMHSKDFDFSFSGLKTALLYELKKDNNWKKRIPEYSYEFQQAVIDVLIKKTVKAARKYNIKTIMLAGGVSANTELRLQMKEAIKTEIQGSNFLIPNLKYTTDNAAMVAAAGYFRAKRKDFTPWQKLAVDCNLELK